MTLHVTVALLFVFIFHSSVFLFITIDAWVPLSTTSSIRKISPWKTTPIYQFEKTFGRQDYWQEFYRSSSQDFCWYATWVDLEPFVREWIDPSDSILLPGIGTDTLLTDLYRAQYRNLTAFDYASESVAYWESRLDPFTSHCIDLRTADARNLPYHASQFDVVLDKGTYDAVYLAGTSVEERVQNLETAMAEVDRVLKAGGTFWSLSAICTEALQASSRLSSWKPQTDGSLYTTHDGYTSNNLDGSLLVWVKPIAL